MPNENEDANSEESSTSHDANREESSTSITDAKPAESMLSVLQKTMDKHVKDSSTDDDDEESASESEANEKPEGEVDGDEKPDNAEETDEEDKGEDDTVETDEAKATRETKEKAENERLDKHPRFRELNEKVNSLKGPAEFGGAVKAYMQKNGIEQADLNQALQVCALLRNNPAAARQALLPILKQLDIVVGETLEPDLEKAVVDGEMTQARAKEFQKLRSEKNMGERSSQQSQTQQRETAYVSAMNGWVGDKMKTDPDYKPKTNGDTEGLFEVTEGFFARMCQQTPPKNPQEAVALAEKAYASAKGMFSKRLAPPLKKVKSLRPSGSGGNRITEPKTLSEAIKMSFDRHTK